MVAAVETMAWTGKVPWHGLGHEVNNNLTPKQMMKAAGCDWKVIKKQLYFDGAKNEKLIVPGKFSLCRETDHQHLSIVGPTYKPIQNEVAFDFFSKFVKAGHMTMETAGSLHGGQYIWVLSRIGKDFAIGKGSQADEMRGYLLICQPHILGKAMVIQFTPIRVVCWNTLNFALGSNLRGGEGAFRVPHSMEFNDTVKKKAESALGLASDQMDEFKQATLLLTKKKAKADDVEDYFKDVLRVDPKKERAKKKSGEEREPRMLTTMRAALTHSPGANLATAKGTWWGAVNAVTYVVDHEMGRDQSAALRTAWMGQKAAMKRRAVSLALERAK